MRFANCGLGSLVAYYQKHLVLEFPWHTAEEGVKRPKDIAILNSFNIANCLDTPLATPAMRARDAVSIKP